MGRTPNAITSTLSVDLKSNSPPPSSTNHPVRLQTTSILDEIRELRKESQDIRQKIQNLSETGRKLRQEIRNLSEELLYSEDEIIFSRINVLDECYSCLKGAEPLAKRQTLPQRIIAGYNGRVRAGVKFIRRYEDLIKEVYEEGISEHVAEWKEAFAKHYSVSFGVVNEKTGFLPWDITRIMDQRANFYWVNKWKVKENEWRSVMVMEIADVILHSWFGSGDGVRKDAELIGRLEKHNEIWDNWIIREA